MSGRHWIWAALAVAALCGACREKAEEAAVEAAIARESGGRVQADLSGGQVKIKTDQGETTYAPDGTASLPADFPKDVFVYPGAALISSHKQEHTYMLNLQTADDARKVADAYRAAMKDQGWSEENFAETTDGIIVEFRNENRTATANIIKDEGRTAIMVFVQTEEPASGQAPPPPEEPEAP